MGVRSAALVLALVALRLRKEEHGRARARAPRRSSRAPPNASVYIDGHYFGRATVLSEEPKTLVPGIHLMTVQAEDHFPHDMELDLPAGVTTITIELRPMP